MEKKRRWALSADPQERFLKMTTEPVPRLITAMAIPAIASQIVSSLYSLADTYFVSSIGTAATAAPGVAFPLLLIIQAISLMLAIGSGSLAARQLGAKKNQDANETISTAFFLSVIIGTIIGIFSLIFITPIMRICGATETILPYAVDYGFWIILATPFYSATFVLSNVVRQEGNIRLATIGTITGAVVNIILDPILIFGFHLGIVGAAIATSLSQIVSFAILFSSIWGDGCVLKLRLRNFKPNKEMMSEIIKIGAPNLFQSGLLIVAQILTNNAAGQYGDAPLAGMNVVNKVSHIIILGLNGFAMGFQPMCGYCYGAKLYKRIKEGLAFTLKVGIAIVTVLCIGAFIFAPQIIALFRADDPEVIDVGSKIMRAHVAVMPFACVTMVANSLFQSCGRAVKAGVLALSRNGIILIPMILILPRLLQLTGVILSQPAADAVTFIIAIVMLIAELRRINRLEEEQNALPLTDNI